MEESIEEGKELVLAIVLFYELVEAVIPQMDVEIIVNNRTVELYPERVYNDLMLVFETNHKGMTSIDIPINPAEHMNEMIPIFQTSIQEFEDAHGWRHDIKLFNYSGTEVLLHLTKDDVLYNEFSEPAAEE